jgi:hypothetical protein
MSIINYNIRALIGYEGKGAQVVADDTSYAERALDHKIDFREFKFLSNAVGFISVSERFKDVIDTFGTPEGETPAGFRVEYNLRGNQLLEIDLVRDISYDKNGEKRPTKFIFSADTANPYELAPVKDLIGNLTCNPGIIYDLFINNEKANVGHKFKTRNEVMEEIGRILGPGVDISVEVNDPWADFDSILEEIAEFEEMLTKYRLVVKVPHTGPVNKENSTQLLEGDKKLSTRWNEAATADYLHGHNLALRLQQRGYKINYTLMFEPWQTGMALQARPYFINSFIRQRIGVTTYINGLLEAYNKTLDDRFLKDLRTYFISTDILSGVDQDTDLRLVEKTARETISYRKINDPEGYDGLDGVRHNLRMLRSANLPDTRLIICSIDGTRNYPELDSLLVDPEFTDMADKIVITTEPNYLAQYTSSPQIVSYQRRFLNAANGEK